MRKVTAIIAVLCLFLSTTVLSGCETFARAFADQAGRNAADAIFEK